MRSAPASILLWSLAAAPALAQVGGVVLGRGPFNGLKARVTAIRFFESARRDVPDRKNRVVTTQFDALTTRFVNLELELEYPRAPKRTQFQVDCRFDGPDGQARTPTVLGEIEAGWVGSYHTAGWGSADRGQWPEGIYKVTCREEGQVVAAAQFEVVKAAAAVHTLGASVTHMKFFGSLAEQVPVETRQYSNRFDGRTARWIKTEFGLVYREVAAPVQFVVECAYVFPDSSVKRGRFERQIPAGWTGSVHAQGIGWPEAGHWPVGKYRVSCWNNGEKMSEGGFEVYDGAVALASTPGGRLLFSSRKNGDPAAAGSAAGKGPPSAASFEVGTYDTLYAEASVPVRAAGDSTGFGCWMLDPAGITSGFGLKGEVREKDKALVASGPVGFLEAPKLRGGYRVECRTGAKAVVAERFSVAGSPDLPELDARLVSSALFEGGGEPPGDEAVPDVLFSIAKLRSLWVVAVLDHPTDKGTPTFAYSCKVTGPKNVVFASTGPQAVALARGDRAIVLKQRLVLGARLKWGVGKYAVACTAGGVPFLRTGFDLTR